MKDIPAGTQKLELWIPVPHDDANQRIANIRIDTPHPYKVEIGDQGNTMLHLEIAQPKATTVPVTVTFEAVRKERIQPTASVVPNTAARPLIYRVGCGPTAWFHRQANSPLGH